MSRDHRKVLDLLGEGKITVEEAERLLALINQQLGLNDERQRERHRERGRERGRRRPGDPSDRYFRVRVEPRPERGADPNGERVDIRIPLGLIRAGIKLASLIPGAAGDRVSEKLAEKGIDFDFRKLSEGQGATLEELLMDLDIDIQDDKERIRITVE